VKILFISRQLICLFLSINNLCNGYSLADEQIFAVNFKLIKSFNSYKEFFVILFQNFNQHKTYAEIARIERISAGDIHAIIKEEQARRKKYKDQQQQEEISSKAYKLFSEERHQYKSPSY
jgi:hypothetical protein